MQSTEQQTGYELHLTPHRSLSKRGFLILMAAISIVSFLTGLYFWSLGAWPVMGFFGLDILAIYLAFCWTYHTGRAREIIRIEDGMLELARISPKGEAETIQMPSFWLRVFMQHERLCLGSHGRIHEVGAFLALEEKQAVCQALARKLRDGQQAV